MSHFVELVNWNVVYGGLFLLWLTYMLRNKLFPGEESFSGFATVINSRGGNIVLLAVMSLFFFVHSMRLIYQLIDMAKDGKIDATNAIAMMGIQFVTGSAFGGSFGALLKTMTGESSKARSSDTTDVTSSITSTVTETPKVEAAPKDATPPII